MGSTVTTTRRGISPFFSSADCDCGVVYNRFEGVAPLSSPPTHLPARIRRLWAFDCACWADQNSEIESGPEQRTSECLVSIPVHMAQLLVGVVVVAFIIIIICDYLLVGAAATTTTSVCLSLGVVGLPGRCRRIGLTVNQVRKCVLSAACSVSFRIGSLLGSFCAWLMCFLPRSRHTVRSVRTPWLSPAVV